MHVPTSLDGPSGISSQPVLALAADLPTPARFHALDTITLHRNWSVFDRADLKELVLGFAFELHNPSFGARSFVFDCSSAKLRAEWMSELRRSIYQVEVRESRGIM
jgi:hypothetical protein